MEGDQPQLLMASLLETDVVPLLIQAREYHCGVTGVRLLPVVFRLPGAVRQQRGSIGSPAILGHSLAQVADLLRLSAVH